MKVAVIINGYGTAGKDEFIKQAKLHYESVGRGSPYINSMSSIDPVRNMLREAGFDVDNKTPQMRNLLAAVGTAVEEFNGWRTTKCAEEAEKFLYMPASMLLRPSAARIFFIHMREAVYITRTVKKLEEKGIKTYKLLICRDGVDAAADNAADMDVMNTDYEYVIANNGTLDDLRKSAAWLIDTVIDLS